ncbi:MAG: hypothetical protein H9533_21510 [Rhodobacteraceae bacterium]|nr:hypothetical protein [Paracoccaceae bacterium]
MAEDSATPSLSLQQIFSFTDTSSSSDPDFQGLNIVNAPNGIGTLTATLLDEATGLGGDTTGSVQWSYSVANAEVQYLAAGETRVMEYRIEVIDLDGNEVPLVS